MRDAKSYCAILLDDNNRKPVVRLHFNRAKKYLGLFDGKQEERVPVASLEDIYEYADRLQGTVRAYVTAGPNGEQDTRRVTAASAGSG